MRQQVQRLAGRLGNEHAVEGVTVQTVQIVHLRQFAQRARMCPGHGQWRKTDLVELGIQLGLVQPQFAERALDGDLL